MAYVPPHRRCSKDADKPSPKPELLAPRSQKKKTFRPKLCYADDAVYAWYPVGLVNDSHGLSAFLLEPISIKLPVDHKMPMVLVKDNNIVEELEDQVVECPWDLIADHVTEKLLCSYENLKKVESYEVDEILPKLVARIGKVIFHGNQSFKMEPGKSVQVDGILLGQMMKQFRTNVPISYVNCLTDEAVSNIGLVFEEEKELYHVKLWDMNGPEYCTISCKCRVSKDSRRLELYKLVTNELCHMVVDISCLDRDLDLRFMLGSKKHIRVLTEDEKKNIKSLIVSAIIDPSVKGGLRWSLGKDSSGERYTVVAVWHTISKYFTSPSFRLEVRNTDRMNFRTSIAEVTQEVTLKMNGILSQLREKNTQADLVAELLKENIKLIWDCFLSCDSLIN